jgi:hypothetical protein
MTAKWPPITRKRLAPCGRNLTPAIFCTFRFGRNSMPVLAFEVRVVARRGVEARSRRYPGVTPTLVVGAATYKGFEALDALLADGVSQVPAPSTVMS